MRKRCAPSCRPAQLPRRPVGDVPVVLARRERPPLGRANRRSRRVQGGDRAVRTRTPAQGRASSGRSTCGSRTAAPTPGRGTPRLALPSGARTAGCTRTGLSWFPRGIARASPATCRPARPSSFRSSSRPRRGRASTCSRSTSSTRTSAGSAWNGGSPSPSRRLQPERLAMPASALPAPERPSAPALSGSGGAPRTRGIPQVVHRVWLGGQQDAPRTAWSTARPGGEHHPGWKFRLWRDRDLRRLVPSDAVARARHHVELSDLLRFEVLRRYGGVYVDTDFECLRPLDPLLEGERVVRGVREARPRRERHRRVRAQGTRSSSTRRSRRRRRSASGRTRPTRPGPYLLTLLVARLPGRDESCRRRRSTPMGGTNSSGATTSSRTRTASIIGRVSRGRCSRWPTSASSKGLARARLGFTATREAPTTRSNVGIS